MNDIEHKLKEYESTIDVIIAKYEDRYRDDLKQELLEYLNDCFLNNKFINARDEKSYLFICLKNQALGLYKKNYKSKVKISSLDDKNTTGIKIENIVSNYGDEGKRITVTRSVSLEELETKICQICNHDDYQLLYNCFVNKIKQYELARELGVTQQAISKRIKHIIFKLRAELQLLD